MNKKKDSPVFETIAAKCLAVRIRLLNRVITNLYDDALRPLGLKVSQLNILVVAAKLGVAHPASVCDLLQLDASTLSRNVERMKAKGWLENVAAEDRRTQAFRPTRKAMQLMARAYPAWQEAQRRAAELLRREGVAFLDKAGRKLGLPPSTS